MSSTTATALNYANHVENSLGGVSLYASANVTADAQGTAVMAGRGWYQIVTTMTAIEVASSDELYIVDIEANTADTTSTWYRLATVAAVGANNVTGRTDDDTARTFVAAVFNPYDYQIRVTFSLVGTTNDSTGITVAVEAFPLPI